MSSKHLGMKMTMIMDVMKTLRSTTHDEVQALGEGDVAPASGELFASIPIHNEHLQDIFGG